MPAPYSPRTKANRSRDTAHPIAKDAQQRHGLKKHERSDIPEADPANKPRPAIRPSREIPSSAQGNRVLIARGGAGPGRARDLVSSPRSLRVPPRFPTRVRPAARQQTFRASPTLEGNFHQGEPRFPLGSSACTNVCFDFIHSSIFGPSNGSGCPRLRPIPPSPTLHQAFSFSETPNPAGRLALARLLSARSPSVAAPPAET